MSKKERTTKQKVLRWVLPPVFGAAFGALSVYLSQLLIRNMDKILSAFAEVSGMSEKELKPVMMMLGSFGTAELASPWLPAMLVGAALALVFVIIWRIKPIKWLILFVINAILLSFLMMIFVPVSLSMTEVNGVSLGATLERVITMLGQMGM